MCSVLRALKTLRTRRPTLLKFSPNMCPPHPLFSRFQDKGTSNGTQSKKALLSDPQLFDTQFDELVTELTERDIADPALTDALNRLREVCCGLII